MHTDTVLTHDPRPYRAFGLAIHRGTDEVLRAAEQLDPVQKEKVEDCLRELWKTFAATSEVLSELSDGPDLPPNPFKDGDLVECIDDDFAGTPKLFEAFLPKKGNVYTVRRARSAAADAELLPSITLVEIPPTSENFNTSFRCRRFRHAATAS